MIPHASYDEKNKEQNEQVDHKLEQDFVYRALHVTVTLLFMDNLKTDKALLDSDKHKDLHKLSPVAKRPPTFGEFHDKHTFVDR